MTSGNVQQQLSADDDMVGDIPLLKEEKQLEQLNKIAKRSPVHIEFENLSYSVGDPHGKAGSSQLLKGVSGKFRSGELTAILGPSGAGKSTLLNILAGYVTAGVKGTINVNDHPRNMKMFNKLSSYIMQDDLIQPRLTVRESMVFAASLKLGSSISDNDKLSVVNEVLGLLGLKTCSETRSEHLSGGQRKRLAVALELVNNPPVIFLDEPTSGLDNVAIKHCVDLLEKISKLGRTVICTIHQPPSSLFQTFKQVYVMADGYCVYNGSPTELVPFLSMSGFLCPRTYTPADYVIELVQSDKTNIKLLSNIVQNGKINMKSESQLHPDAIKSASEDYHEMDVDDDVPQSSTITTKNNITFATSLWVQYVLLVKRMTLQAKRNKSVLYIQFFHHLLSGLLLGGIFFGIGNNASQTVAIFKYCVSVNVFFMFTHVMTPVLLFPLEVKLLRREYFNRWYSLKAYYLALSVTSLPLLIFPGFMFLIIVYFITNQPLDGSRFIMFCLMGMAVGLCSQSLGFAVGSILNITKGSIVASAVLAPLMALAVYGMGYVTRIEPIMKGLMALSYLRYGVVGFCSSVFSNREPLECTDEIYCHYRQPEILMRDMGMADSHFIYQLGFVLFYTLLFRLVGYLMLMCRLNSEISQRVVYYAKKAIKLKF